MTAPIQPMLAAPMSKAQITNWSDWYIEEKYDGVRLIVDVSEGGIVRAWTRPRKHAGSDGKTMAPRALPAHLSAELSRLPIGTYDGELLAGDTSTDVTRTDLAHTLRLVVFDVLKLAEVTLAPLPYRDRRHALTVIKRQHRGPYVTVAPAQAVTSEADVVAFVQQVWARGGEGAILKRASARYYPGKRSDAFVKVKKLHTAVLTVVGFEATRGTVMNRGAYATVILEDAQGNRTSVKTKDDYELAQFNKHTGTPETHPALGRSLRIEYQDWTPRGGYRHPRWDRWEAE